MSPESEWEPKLLGFLCRWCSYAGADTAGTSRIAHSPGFRVIRTMCSGRVNTTHVLDAFRLGADGVLISGCHIGDCHYIFGNHWAIKQFDVTRERIRQIEAKALRKLRHPSRSEQLRSFLEIESS